MASLDNSKEIKGPTFRDVKSKRYLCNYCSVSRSKKCLIKAHMDAFHKEEIEKRVEDEEEATGPESKTCKDCGSTFKNRSCLERHMQGHSLERPFSCQIENCSASFRWKDSLVRHLNKHKGMVFKCPIDGCGVEFTYKGNIKRHTAMFHGDKPRPPSSKPKGQNHCVCPEPGCSKVFKYPSMLRKHQDSHVKLCLVEALCLEPGCMQHFSNAKCLKAHVSSCHRYIKCETCSTDVLRRNFNRHRRVHVKSHLPTRRMKCYFKDCSHTFSTKINLNKHVKVAHLKLKPFVCGFSGCGKRFSYKHVRDRHENSGFHVYTPGDFEVSDEQFRSRPRGGRRRICPTVDMLVRKRIRPSCTEIGHTLCTP